mgnify:CR=1 FL=1
MLAPFPRDRAAYRTLLARHFPWDSWQHVIDAQGITLDRPAHTAHPTHPTIVYPMDYGYVKGTCATDEEPVDCFVGTAANGLVGLIATTDHRKEDREIKLLIDCSPPEIYTAHGFINYDRTLLEGLLVLRHPMHTLWSALRTHPSSSTLQAKTGAQNRTDRP